METIGEKLRKTANEFADRLGEAAHTAGERIGEMREIQRINGQIRDRKKEKDRCKMAMADLLIRMFDQNTFAEALLRPEYNRIKEIDGEIAELVEEREQVVADNTPTPEAPAPAEASAGEQTPPAAQE